MCYQVNSEFSHNFGFALNYGNIVKAIEGSNSTFRTFPANLYHTVDLKTSSSIVGAVFCGCLVKSTLGAIVNPIEKGHPDIVPNSAAGASEEQLRNYPEGLEIKTTVGNIKSGSNYRPGQRRLEVLSGITWQAHHQEVRELMALIWDFNNLYEGFLYPMITGVFFSAILEQSDWGAISGTTGRNTKVCGMTASGRSKMKAGWIVLHKDYSPRYLQLL